MVDFSSGGAEHGGDFLVETGHVGRALRGSGRLCAEGYGVDHRGVTIAGEQDAVRPECERADGLKRRTGRDGSRGARGDLGRHGQRGHTKHEGELQGGFHGHLSKELRIRNPNAFLNPEPRNLEPGTWNSEPEPRTGTYHRRPLAQTGLIS